MVTPVDEQYIALRVCTTSLGLGVREIPYSLNHTNRVPYQLLELENLYLDHYDRYADSMMAFDTRPSPSERDGMLTVMLNRIANSIARTTRRGKGNAVVMSPHVYEFIKQRVSAHLVAQEPEPISSQSSLLFAGVLFNSMRVFVRPDWDAENPVVVAYKGQSQGDAGMFAVAAGNEQFFRGDCWPNPESVSHRWTDYTAALRIIA